MYSASIFRKWREPSLLSYGRSVLPDQRERRWLAVPHQTRSRKIWWSKENNLLHQILCPMSISSYVLQWKLRKIELIFFLFSCLLDQLFKELGGRVLPQAKRIDGFYGSVWKEHLLQQSLHVSHECSRAIIPTYLCLSQECLVLWLRPEKLCFLLRPRYVIPLWTW